MTTLVVMEAYLYTNSLKKPYQNLNVNDTAFFVNKIFYLVIFNLLQVHLANLENYHIHHSNILFYHKYLVLSI